MVDKALFSSDSDEWETPQWLFDLLDQEFNFKIDLAATYYNTKCENFFSKERSFLESIYLHGNSFCNPPYSKTKDFIKRIHYLQKTPYYIVLLIPSRTDTKYWHEYVMHSSEIRFIKGRLKFNGSKNSAPFPSCIVIFDGIKHDHPIISSLVKK